ncbi:hypothetical protein [Streptosporangium sp. NPDC087985]|uniref:hypothetical protein n=1 Tax=Streptosporangium sp. NPDC087985 TaxID=3366196 RepID=UPI00380360F6
MNVTNFPSKRKMFSAKRYDFVSLKDKAWCLIEKVWSSQSGEELEKCPHPEIAARGGSRRIDDYG